ncbi:MAG: nitroreductase family protein [Acidimicrobiia bacterium]|nr:nitroreductase family protein [Acidimicrobiia bacterium]
MTETAPPPQPGPTTDPSEVAERLRMPMVDAMQTQRAVRRLITTEPVAHEVLLPLLELSLKAPTSSNTQDWTYLVVEDPEQKARIGKVYGRLYKLFNPIVTRQAKGDPQELRNMAPGQWQAEHFAEIPVLVIPCYRKNMNHRPTGRPQIRVSSFYGSVYPAVQNLLLACRAVGLGASLQTLPIWWIPSIRKILDLPRDVRPVCIIPIGWAKGRYGPTTRTPIGEVVHLDHFGNQPFMDSAG